MAAEEATIEFQTTSVIIIPDAGNGGESAQGEPSPKSLAEQLEEAKLDAKKSAEALDDLISGIRAVKRFLDCTPADENDTSRAESISKDEELIADLSSRLHGILGSDLMALANAANMARGHAKLASDEAASSVSELQAAKAESEANATRARTAEKITRKLYKDNLALQQQVSQLKKERRTLVKAVRDLQQEQEETSRFDTWRLLEEHVQNSVSIHEMILKTPPRGASKASFFDTANESSRSTDDDGSNFSRAPPSVEKSKTNGRISPTPTASCSEDSMSYNKQEGESVPASLSGDREDEENMPTDVSLIKRRPTSPLATPTISPAGAAAESQELKPIICDPNILRTLAIPSGDKRVDGSDLPSPRVRIAPGLYEV